MSLNGIYLGLVEKNNDPEGLGRLKVRVPTVYGILGGTVGAIPVDLLPWALPMGLPAGGSNTSGGFSMLPDIGDQVAVQFLDGEPEKPTWQWLMQNRNQAQTLRLHQYVANDNQTGAPARTILTRNGHSLEIRPEKVTLTTAEGQQVLLQTSQAEGGGAAALQTPKGQAVRISDLNQNMVLQALDAIVASGKKVMVNAPTSALIKTERLTLMAGSSMIVVEGNTISITTASGAAMIVDADGNVAVNSAGGASVSIENDKVQIGEPLGTGAVIEAGKISINAPQCVMNTSAFSIGTGEGSPVFLLTADAIAYFLGHTHTNGNEGSPTGPPIPTNPLFPLNSASQTVQTT